MHSYPLFEPCLYQRAVNSVMSDDVPPKRSWQDHQIMTKYQSLEDLNLNHTLWVNDV